MTTKDAVFLAKEVAMRHFMRHVVAMYFDIRKGEDVRQFLHSAFVLSASGHWLLVTAGHCIREMETYRSAGYHIEHCRLADGFNLRAKFLTEMVPFGYFEADPTVLFDDLNWDYGLLTISDNTREMLQANGVVPLDENSWGGPDAVGAFVLLGIPHELTKVTPEKIHIHAVMIDVEKLAERPEYFPETNAPMFYGHLVVTSDFKLKGLSGSPILSVVRDTKNQGIRYWLHAMQVSAITGTKDISGVLMLPLGRFLQQAARAMAAAKGNV
jgi:hypothetical protein